MASDRGQNRYSDFVALETLLCFENCSSSNCLLTSWRRFLPSPCTAFSQSFSVNSFRWRIRGERAGNAFTFSHGPRDPKRFGREEKWGLGTRQASVPCLRVAVLFSSGRRYRLVSSCLRVVASFFSLRVVGRRVFLSSTALHTWQR